LRRSRLQEKVDAERTTRHGISSHGLWPGDLINILNKNKIALAPRLTK